MQMTPSQIERDNVNLNKLLTGIRTSMDHFLTDYRDENLYIGSAVAQW